MGSNSRLGHCLKHIFFDIWMPESAWRKKCMKIGDPQIIMIPQYSDEKAWNINRLCIHLFLLSVNSYGISLTTFSNQQWSILLYCLVILLFAGLYIYICVFLIVSNNFNGNSKYQYDMTVNTFYCADVSFCNNMTWQLTLFYYADVSFCSFML